MSATVAVSGGGGGAFVCSRGVCSGGCLLWGMSARGVSAPRGCLLWGVVVSALGVVVSALGGVSAPGCACFWGVSAPGRGGGGSIPACTKADIPPVDRMTDTCKNITFATSLRTVMIVYEYLFKVQSVFFVQSTTKIFFSQTAVIKLLTDQSEESVLVRQC